MSLSRPYKSARPPFKRANLGRPSRNAYFGISIKFGGEKKINNNCKYTHSSKTYTYQDEYYDPATKSYKVGSATSITSCENAKTNFYAQYGRHSPGPRPPHQPPSPLPKPRPTPKPVPRYNPKPAPRRPVVVTRPQPYPVYVPGQDPDVYNITYNNGQPVQEGAEIMDPQNGEEVAAEEEVVMEETSSGSGVEFLNDIPMPLLLGGLGLIFVVLLMRK